MNKKTSLSRRDFLRAVALTSAAAALPAGCMESSAVMLNQPPHRPNVILIMAETMSAKELGCYGNTKHYTPNIDKLAREGVQFNTCWSTAICIPTRAEIITGRYGFRTGWYHNLLRFPGGQPYKMQLLTERNMVIAEPLKKAGYATAFASKWQLPGDPGEYHFDESNWWPGYFHTPEMRKAYQEKNDGFRTPDYGFTPDFWNPFLVENREVLATTDEDFAPDIWVDFINDFARKNAAQNKPFFTYYAANLCHVGWDVHQQKHSAVSVPEVDENGNKTGGIVKGSYKANIEYLDFLVGKIVRNLEELGIRDNTVIMFTADHGSDDYGKWFMVEERGIRVPMIVNAPGFIRPMGKRDELVDLSDVFPTVCELANAPVPEGYVLDGHSFAPLLLGRPFTPREWIFSYVADQRALRDERWLLDGYGHFYDCGSSRDETGYKDVTDSMDPQVLAARRRFDRILENLPGPDLSEPYVQECLEKIDKKIKQKPLYQKFKEAQKL